MFLGTHINKLDKKGRMTLPASFRTSLGSEFVLSLSQKQPCLEGFSIDRMKKITQQIDRKNIFSQEHHALAIAICADAEIMFCDKDGRCVLGQHFYEHANLSLDSQITCVGLGSTFQIWNSLLFSEEKKHAKEHIKNTQPSLFVND